MTIKGRWKDNCFEVNLGLFRNCEASATGSQPDKHTGNARAMKIRAQRTDSGARLRRVVLTVFLRMMRPIFG